MADLINRPRRLRFHPGLRDLVAEARLDPRLFVMPHFVLRDPHRVEDINAMPGIQRQGIEPLLRTVEADLKLGIRSVLLFGVPGDDEPKYPDGRGAYDEQALIPQAVRALKQQFGQDLVVMTDVCLCAYTDHGHCGVIEHGKVVNDPSLEHLARMALAHARAGADVVAPSDMMDGRVAAIREALDEEGYVDTPIMSYSVKYASAYYGPFREAAHSAPQFGDRKSYQMDARNRREAVLEAELDVAEGADILMVKPGLAYLDVVRELKEHFVQPVAVYNVSGEYSMVKAAAQKGWIDERLVVLENLHAFRRAGADIIITYHARDVLANRWL
ncbi:MAG: porphobilinogen synthase [Thermoanaerobaculum sp.]|nr:porphobilinogen synthase [Thermoanaerobaculum sp.]